MDVSIIIPVFNRSECLQRAVDSVQAQATGLALELIIVDDGSRDQTVEALHRIKLLSKIPCTVLVNETRLGGAAARNRGARAACGKYLAFLDSDDEWLPTHIESKLAAMQKAGAQGVYGTFFVQSRYSRVLRDFDERDERNFSMADYILRGKGDARTSTFVFHRTAFLEFGFDSNLNKHQDWDLAIRFAQARSFALDKTPTAVLHTVGKDRMSGTNDHSASALFMEKHDAILSNASKARMYNNLALRTLRYEGKNDASREYLRLARQFADKRDFRLLYKKALLGLPFCNTVRIGDYGRETMSAIRQRLKELDIVRWGYSSTRKMILRFSLRACPVFTAKCLHKWKLGVWPDLDNPTTFNEKLQWLKLYWPHPRLPECADKYEVRNYIRECGCEELLNELYGVWEDARDIDWDSLPEEFVLKVNNGCGRNIFCRNKNNLDKSAAIKKLNRWMRQDYSLHLGEHHYSKIKPRIICEKYLHNPGADKAVDYKLHCFNGKVGYILTVTERSDDGFKKYHFADLEWNGIDVARAECFENKPAQRPESLQEMIRYAEILSKPFPFVRVDLYECDRRPVFGELTFTPAACMWDGYTPAGAELLGSMLRLPPRLEERSL